MSGVARPSPGELGANPLFEEIGAADLEWIASRAEAVQLEPGEVVFREGEEADRFVVLLAGELVITTTVEGREDVLARHDKDAPPPVDRPSAAYGFTGEMPILAGVPYVATACAGRGARVAILTASGFRELLERCPQVCRVLLPVLAWRLHSSSMQAGQRSKLVALGTLAAGLAHELNNPASALRRSARELGSLSGDLAEAAAAWGSVAGPGNDLGLLRRLETLPGRRGGLTALKREEAEDSLLDLLAVEDISGETRDLLLESMLERENPEQSLRELLEEVAPQHRPAALRLAALRLAVIDEVEAASTASARISAIIADARVYTNLDRAPQQVFDVAAGLESTLQMLRGRLQAVRVERDYPTEPLMASGYPGELNQVWTNLIANALDAMAQRHGEPTQDGPGGTLRLIVRPEGGCVSVTVQDDGPGISAEARERIFEPFFTTKDIGKGTGLGLHLSHRIVTERHRGSLTVDSVPGRTCFIVRFPRGIQEGAEG